MSAEELKDRDLLERWLELSREVLGRYYPASSHATLVIPLGDGIPDCVLAVTPLRQPSPPLPPPLS